MNLATATITVTIECPDCDGTGVNFRAHQTERTETRRCGCGAIHKQGEPSCETCGGHTTVEREISLAELKELLK